MKKLSYLLVTLVTVVLGAFLLVGCGSKVKDNEILVGNTASKTGAYNAIGLPFGNGIAATYKYYNDGKLEGGLVNDTKIFYKWYDDKSDKGTGVKFTKKLIEDDKVLALTGHFGTWTIEPTADLLREKNIPMIHAASGTNTLQTIPNKVGEPIMPIQPIYYSDGQIILARIIQTQIFGDTKDKTLLESVGTGVKPKVKFAYTDDAAGKSIKEGIEKLIEEKNLGEKYEFSYEITSPDSSAAVAGKIKDADAIAILSNQPAYQALINQLNNVNYGKPIFTSYVNADSGQVKPENVTNLQLYFNGWYRDNDDPLARQAFEVWRKVCDNYYPKNKKKADELYNSTHAKSGHIAAMTFIEGVRRYAKSGKDISLLTYKNRKDYTQARKDLITALESSVINLPFAGTVDFTNGQRRGTLDAMLWKYNKETKKFDVAKPLDSLTNIIGS